MTMISATFPVTKDWVNANTLTGVTSWTKAFIQNKSNDFVYVALGAGAPSSLDEGVMLAPIGQTGNTFEIPGASVTVWIRSNDIGKFIVFQY